MTLPPRSAPDTHASSTGAAQISSPTVVALNEIIINHLVNLSVFVCAYDPRPPKKKERGS